MNTREFLKDMDLAQLRFARDCVAEMILAKESESFVSFWVVADDCVNVAAFAENDYSSAVERAHLLIDEEAARGQSFIVRLDKERRRESEVADLLKLESLTRI